jgi:hypothetical protein
MLAPAVELGLNRALLPLALLMPSLLQQVFLLRPLLLVWQSPGLQQELKAAALFH